MCLRLCPSATKTKVIHVQPDKLWKDNRGSNHGPGEHSSGGQKNQLQCVSDGPRGEYNYCLSGK